MKKTVCFLLLFLLFLSCGENNNDKNFLSLRRERIDKIIKEKKIIHSNDGGIYVYMLIPIDPKMNDTLYVRGDHMKLDRRGKSRGGSVIKIYNTIGTSYFNFDNYSSAIVWKRFSDL